MDKQKTVDSCKTQGVNVDDHFREVTKMVEIGKVRKMDILLTCPRRGCTWITPCKRSTARGRLPKKNN
jgi:hypothetical protein